MPVDTWLTGYLLSFGAQVEIIEPKYLKGILAEQAQEIYKKINLDKRCQDICVILMTITIQLYRNFNHNLFVVYTERIIVDEGGKSEEVIRLISARLATSFERGVYYGKRS